MPWQRMREKDIEVSVGAGSNHNPRVLEETQADCDQCGAVLAFEPGSEQVRCNYCGTTAKIASGPVKIVERDLETGLAEAEGENTVEETLGVSCASCQAFFSFDQDQHAGECPFCGHAIVKDTGIHKRIKPAAILPFVVAQAQAKSAIKHWLQSLWFAPGKLHSLARPDGQLSGVYLPYWTFDSDVRADYVGQRGEFYLSPEKIRVRVDGREEVRTRMVQKVRWRPARGQVRRHFNDILVLASRSIPRWMADRLGPWDLGALKPYTPHYVQGFQSHTYNIGLATGFETAESIIRSRIVADIRMHIGGDLQRIEGVEVDHASPHFKHILLPIWLGIYRYRGRVYHVSVNGQTNEVQGERPYSFAKIAGVISLITLVIFIAIFALNSGALPKM